MTRIAGVSFLAVLATAFLPLGIADAHIHLTNPLSRTDSETGDQKDQHCGLAGQGRIASRVTTFQPGQSITVTWMETINHPGHYRIAFQADGETFGIPAAGSGPPAGFPNVDLTGMTDGAGALILKDRIPDGTLSTQITLPSMECSNCTLQFIQVMTDKSPYTTDMNSDDIYFNCADITLSNTAPPPTDGPVTPGQEAGVDPPEGGVSGCCSTSGGTPSGLALGLLVGAVIFRRRRAR